MIKGVYNMDNLKVVDLTKEELKELKEFDYDLDLYKDKNKKDKENVQSKQD